MGDSEKRAEGQKQAPKAWSDFQTAFTKLIAECTRQELASAGPQRSSGSSHSADLRKMVAEGVSAVLMEASFLEKVLARHIKTYLDKNPPPATSEGGVSETSKQEIKKFVGEFLQERLAAFIQRELLATIQKEVKSLLTSIELKELIDDKFRLISVYLKTDVIPKAVQKELARANS